jgi:hypothetical protein
MSEFMSVVPAPSSSVQQALQHSVSLFHAHHDPNLVFHNYQFCNSVCEKIRQIAQAEKDISSAQTDQAQLAAIFYTLGIVTNKSDAPNASLSLWKKYSDKTEVDSDTKTVVVDSLRSYFQDSDKNTVAKKLLADGINAQKYGLQDSSLLALYKMESISRSDKDISNLEWNKAQFNTLKNVLFHFPYSQLAFRPAVNQKLLDYAQKIKRNERNGPKAWEHEKLRNFQNLEKRLPNDATQTFFRANFRNHINLSAIADQKANIMISVNAIMISVIISVLSYRNITETSPMIIMPAVIFVTTGLTSLICAVLSARPKVTRINTKGMPMEEMQKNIVFFGSFVNLNLDQYEEAVDAMFRDSELIYGNMVRDLYFLGKVLDQKYKYLAMSYDVFMVGFVVTVITFMITYLT